MICCLPSITCDQLTPVCQYCDELTQVYRWWSVVTVYHLCSVVSSNTCDLLSPLYHLCSVVSSLILVICWLQLSFVIYCLLSITCDLLPPVYHCDLLSPSSWSIVPVYHWWFVGPSILLVINSPKFIICDVLFPIFRFRSIVSSLSFVNGCLQSTTCDLLSQVCHLLTNYQSITYHLLSIVSCLSLMIWSLSHVIYVCCPRSLTGDMLTTVYLLWFVVSSYPLWFVVSSLSLA